MTIRLSLAVLAFALAAGAAAAQAPAAVTGTVKSVTADHVVIATATGDVDLAVTPQTRVLARQKASAEEIKAGAYLGTANVTTADGGVANEVHLMATGPNVANTAMGAPNLVMTNGHVKSVKTTPKGQEMDVDYGGAETRHVVVPANTPVTRLAAATLTPGATVSARTATGADGKMAATFIQVTAAK
jgi:hypothetical protein